MGAAAAGVARRRRSRCMSQSTAGGVSERRRARREDGLARCDESLGAPAATTRTSTALDRLLRRPSSQPRAQRRPPGTAAASPTPGRRPRRPASSPSSLTGWTCAATAAPTASCHRPKTPPSAPDRGGAARRPPAAPGPMRRTQAAHDRTEARRSATRGSSSRLTVAGPSPAVTAGSGIDAQRSRRAERRRAASPAVVRITWPAGRWSSSACGARGVELAEHVVEHAAPGCCRPARPPAGAPRGAAPAPACAARPARRACAPGMPSIDSSTSSRCGPTVDTPRRTSSRRGVGQRRGETALTPRRLVAQLDRGRPAGELLVRLGHHRREPARSSTARAWPNWSPISRQLGVPHVERERRVARRGGRRPASAARCAA